MTNSICKTDDRGNKFWYNDKGEFHREGDLPAVEFSNGTKYWVLNGCLHRENGPAVEHADGRCEWWVDGELVDCTDNNTFLRMMKLKVFW